MIPDSTYELGARISSLERTRSFSFVLAAIAIIAAVVVGLGAGRGDVRTNKIEGKEIVIVDNDGRASIRIGPDREGKQRGVVEFLDSEGRRRIVLGIDNGGSPAIRLIEPEAGLTTVLNIAQKFGAGIAFGSRDRKSGILMCVSQSGVAALGFMGEDGNPHVTLGVQPDGTAELRGLNAKGQQSFKLPP